VWRERSENPQPFEPTSSERQAVFLSPIYEHLETNIPKPLMGFSDKPFAQDLQLFPTHRNVQQYLEEYAEDIRSLIRFQTQVVDVRFHQEPSLEDGSVKELWSVTTVHLPSGKTCTDIYGAVVVASGHFSTPYVPDIPGVHDWSLKYPGSISHSKYYRVPTSFTGKKIIVVGNSASGLDISSQLSSICRPPILLSLKSESFLAGGFAENSNIESVPQICRFDSDSQTIRFSNGRTETNVDSIIFCTGYLYTMPFLKSLEPNPIGNGTRVGHTYLHLFYAPHPTLSFLVLPQKIIPFPLSQAQAAVLARVYSGRLGLPSKTEMETWEEETIAESGDEGGFHTLKFPKDAEYLNFLCDWAGRAARRNDLEQNGSGKLPKRWGEWEYWARERFPQIRKAFVQRGKERKHITSLKELGLDFEPWQVNGTIIAQDKELADSL
jgi:hypothetical protein